MQAMKTLLAVMGVLIVLGFAFVGFEIYQRATDPDHPRAFGRAAPAAAGAPAAVADAGTGTLLPAGSRIGQMLVLNNRVLYHVTLPDGSEQIQVLDPANGRVRIAVTAPPSMAAGPAATP
ncbi:hypothetical protein [Rhodocista pekingensis]|uniref:PepSY domain-containing protein n=1 Tax=Rhodocista pekingensis TaxID=201185 RepID=A0ABW2KVN1_9PROT